MLIQLLLDYQIDGRNKLNPGYYQVYEIDLPVEDCQQLFDHQNFVDFNQPDVGYRLTPELGHWSPNVSLMNKMIRLSKSFVRQVTKYSSHIELNYPRTQSLPRHKNVFNHTLNHNRDVSNIEVTLSERKSNL